MIVSCEKCNLQFLIKKNDIPKNGRIVKCGICNSEWLQKPYNKEVIPVAKKHYFANLFLLLLLILFFTGLMVTFKKEMLLIYPPLNMFYDNLDQFNYHFLKKLNLFLKEIIQSISRLL
tara:strand:- start:2211 stop:2564 length:354 start_codon:yes stop_codon:yes gene_type:complete